MDLKFYKEEVRDWLNDPLATNLKSQLFGIGKPVPIPDSECTEEYKLIKMETRKKSTAFSLLSSLKFKSIETVCLSELFQFDSMCYCIC